jgi:2-polyprenyl-3-methyl-5-hydroxy-6-metoxy-1,4-benzoquinol methylase
MTCKICSNSENFDKYVVKEMMFGFRDEFMYFQCKKCFCLQIGEIPENMNKYYPNNYYSYISNNNNRNSIITQFIKKERDKYAVFNKGFFGKLIYYFKPNIKLKALSEAHITKDSFILDVGCGNGVLLNNLGDIGFKNLTGIDPYIDKDIKYHNGVNVQKKEISDVMEKQDLIMLHHSFEHMSNPLEILRSIEKLLKNDGYCVIRIPTVSSYAWRHYKEKWVQLDAPRHFFLHSRESMELLTKKASLEIVKIVYDSSEFQFLGSERYLKDIHLYDNIKDNQIFSPKEIKNFRLKAKELNQKQDGDACAYYLKKAKN